MEPEQDRAVILECPAGYSLSGNGEMFPENKEVMVQLCPDVISILTSARESFCYQYREILQIDVGDYLLILNLVSGEKIRLSHLGYLYEDFMAKLFKLRSEMLIRDMLMQEAVHKDGLSGEYVCLDDTGRELHRGACEPRLYKTSLVVIPEQNDPLRIPYSEIQEIIEGDYDLSVITEDGLRVVLSMMGYNLDPCKQALREAMGELDQDTRALITGMLPGFSPQKIGLVSHLFRDGKAAPRSEIESISPGFWNELERAICCSPIAEEYAYLKSLARQDKICIGVKKGLMGNLTGEYIWCLFPMYSLDLTQPGNALAMESLSSTENGGGKATYFFRLVSRIEYPEFADLDALHREADIFIRQINRSLLAINFRREPIYLSEEKLAEPQHIKYRYTLTRLPSLRELRTRFIGKVSHTTPEQWRKDVDSLLKFNVSSRNDLEQWSKGN